jgi:hypothetical protein
VALERPGCNRASVPEPTGTLNSGHGRRVAARVRIHGGEPCIRVHLAAFRIERTVKLPNPAAGDATKTLGGQRIRPRRRVLAALRIHGASSPARACWRPVALRIRHCAGRHRAPGAKPGPPMASGMPNPVNGRRVVAGMCIHGARVGDCAVLLGLVWKWGGGESFRRRPPPGNVLYGQRLRR